MQDRQIVLIAHNIRSCHNVGSLLRTADGIGVEKVWLTGYTPHPNQTNDHRLPHEAQKIDKQIRKTALGAEESVDWQTHNDVLSLISELKDIGYQVVAIEQTTDSIELQSLKIPHKIALILGREVEGLEPEVVTACDETAEIKMLGQKESFNVVQAAAMALYRCRFVN